MTRTLPDRHEALPLVQHLLPKMGAAVVEAVGILAQRIALDREQGVVDYHDPSLKAHMLNHYVEHALCRNLSGEANVTFVRGASFGVVCDDHLFIRPKKVDTQLRPKNIPTPRSKAMLANSTQIPLFPDGPVVLTLGYQVDLTWTRITSALLICHNKHAEALWHIDVLGALPAAEPLPFVLPDEPVSPALREVLKVRDRKLNG